MYIALRLLVVIILCLWSLPDAASAKSFKVNSGFDVNDLTPGNGLCVAYLTIFPPFVIPFCTLRAAVEESNSLPGEDSIELPSGIFSFDRGERDEDNALSGDLDITESLTIRGKGPNATIIDAKYLDRIFDIRDPGAKVTLQDLSLVNGRIQSRRETVFSGGGAIRNRGNLVLRNVVLLQHRVSGGGVYDQGGIVQNSGQCLISHSTLQSGSAYEGGGLYNDRDGNATIRSSTLSGNDAVSGAAVFNNGMLRAVNSTFSGNGTVRTEFGGGLNNRRDLVFEHVTVARNQAVNGGGVSSKGSFSLHNTIIAENSTNDCYQITPILSEGSNLDSDGSCGMDHPNDYPAAIAGLRGLEKNGGVTETHGLFLFSEARDNGSRVDEVLVDQRGVARPWGAKVDIGAVEFNGFPVVPMVYPLLKP
ncbi:MAG: right-handed parallel beta-helix repeat-containing protein [Desulfopila sp.]|jgi:hypothetical protein|nr:right-handed parallel beta-helix repeat-containing protein [Desulfopila sp.]